MKSGLIKWIGNRPCTLNEWALTRYVKMLQLLSGLVQVFWCLLFSHSHWCLRFIPKQCPHIKESHEAWGMGLTVGCVPAKTIAHWAASTSDQWILKTMSQWHTPLPSVPNLFRVHALFNTWPHQIWHSTQRRLFPLLAHGSQTGALWGVLNILIWSEGPIFWPVIDLWGLN